MEPLLLFLHKHSTAVVARELVNGNNYRNICEVLCGAYGDGTAPDAERAALVEAWAGLIQMVYTDRMYGTQYNNPLPTSAIITESRR